MSDDSNAKDNPIEQVLSDLFQYFETLEAQNSAVLQFLKGQKIVTDKKFAPYLEQAATASNVKWRAARVRMEHLFATAPKPAAKPSEAGAKEVPKQEPKQTEGESADDKSSAAREPKVAAEETANKEPSESSDRIREGSRKGEEAAQAQDPSAVTNPVKSKTDGDASADKKNRIPISAAENNENADHLSKQPESQSHTSPKPNEAGSERVKSEESARKDAA